MKALTALGVFITAVSVSLFLVIYFRSVEQANFCEELRLGPDCSTHNRPAPARDVRLLISTVRSPHQAHLFASRREIFTNRVSYIEARLPTVDGVYTINVFPDSVTYWFRDHSSESSNFTWADHEFDGMVDFGAIGDVSALDAKHYDIDFRKGLHWKNGYQQLYNFRLRAILIELGL
ncbi:MAG TPA: hypothetical protein PKD79_01950 [Candidatus Doudnabacteria bacterium]|nr:hypothetical protein [Candidatus Doudnabacteria bacterium]